MLTASEVGTALGEPVSAVVADLPAGIGGRQCTWAGADGRALVVEIRVDADLDPALLAAGESARSVLDESIATVVDIVMAVPGLGIEAFIGDGHIYVAATAGTLVLDDQAGLDAASEVVLARLAVARL